MKHTIGRIAALIVTAACVITFTSPANAADQVTPVAPAVSVVRSNHASALGVGAPSPSLTAGPSLTPGLSTTSGHTAIAVGTLAHVSTELVPDGNGGTKAKYTMVADNGSGTVQPMDVAGQYYATCINAGRGYAWSPSNADACPGWYDLYISGNHLAHLDMSIAAGAVTVSGSCWLALASGVASVIWFTATVGWAVQAGLTYLGIVRSC